MGFSPCFETGKDMHGLKPVLQHVPFMRRCLELAERGRGKVSPNPLVGCVVVKDGRILAEGWHEALGARHAERMALERAPHFAPLRGASPFAFGAMGDKSRGKGTKGGTLYVNLEPCCKAGKQPPCVEMILQAGISEVVFGVHDPSNPGAEFLQEKGVRVLGPILEEECRRLNRGFFSVLEQGRPWVTLKKAMMRDGRFANPEGQPRLLITSEEQDEWSHVHLRATHDAILVGSGTIIADNPQLAVRFGTKNEEPFDPAPHSAKASRGRQGRKPKTNNPPHPRRVILDPHGEVPPTAVVLTDADAERTLVIREKLPIPELLQKLQAEGITSLLVEGGPGVWKSFEESECIDEVVYLIGRSFEGPSRK